MRSIITRRELLAGASAVATLAITRQAKAADDWKAKWDGIVAAAEKEGEINASGPAGKIWRDELMEFQKAYPKIRLNVTPAASRDFWPRVIKEREVGQNLWDLRIGGADTQIYQLAGKGELANIREMLVLPEVANEDNWYGGFDHMFTDNARKTALSFGVYSSPLANYNPKFIKAEEIKSFQDLLDPKWKGKIAMVDPRGGSTAVSMAIVYKKYGPEFLKDLLVKQQPTIVTNARQMMDWYISGKYPIAMGIPNSSIQQFAQSGVTVEMGEISGLDIWSVGVCGIQVLEPRPHPNATTVFINWLLTKDTQARIMKAVKLNSRRKDVPVEYPEGQLDWSRYKDYISGQSEDLTEAMSEFKKLARAVLK
jgi:iron(III) transport system substrate-binding protein